MVDTRSHPIAEVLSKHNSRKEAILTPDELSGSDRIRL